MTGASLTRLISETMKKALYLLLIVALAACEKPATDDYEVSSDANVQLRFTMTNSDYTRALAYNYFTKLNVQLFTAEGEKVFNKIKTQESEDDGFGELSLNLAAGDYWVVAVGHSSARSATIKSTEAVQFTASDGEKLTDTFCHCSQITVGGDSRQYNLQMYRVGAMIQFCLKDDNFPENFSHFKMDYTGGSANFNPQTLEGITKSTQSEKRATNGVHIYQAYTFPYLSATGTVKMTCTALDVEGNTIRQRVFENVPVARNRITTYTGPFFGEGDGEFVQTDFSFLIHADWDGETKIDF